MFKFVAVVFAAVLAIAFAAPKAGVVTSYTSPVVSYGSPYVASPYVSTYGASPYYGATYGAAYGAAPYAYSAYGYGAAPVAYY